MKCLEKSWLNIPDLVSFIHGSTVAINTVIEGKGARTALVVTRGLGMFTRLAGATAPKPITSFSTARSSGAETPDLRG